MFGWTHNMFATYLVLVLAVSTVHAGNEFQPLRRDHVNLKRMVRRRDIPALVPVIGAGQDPAENPPVTSTTAVGSVTTSGATVPTVSSAISISISTTGTPNVVNSLLSDLVSSTSASSSSITSSTLNSTSSSSTVTTSTSSSTSTTQAPTTPPPPAAPIATSSHGRSTSTIIKTAEQEESTSVPAPTGAAATKSKTLEVIIIIASSIGGIAILWTVFRKWKLGRSSKFNERLQPIDWQKPTGENNNNEVMPGIRRAASNASSFHSASVHDHHGDASHLQPIPEHDFTAGAAPVGGYADLARGPSPPMGQVHGGAALGRGYEYDNGVPLHHQAGGAYGAYDYQGATRY